MARSLFLPVWTGFKYTKELCFACRLLCLPDSYSPSPRYTASQDYDMADDQTAAAISDEKFEEKKQSTSAIKSFLSGGFGGVSAVLVGHPFDLTKVRLQTAAPGTYTGGLDVVKKTLKADGVRGMYRGMGPPLVGVTPIFAISFWSYDTGKKIVYSLTPDRKDPKLGYGELAFAGFFSAIPTTLVAGPAERVKVLLQLQGQGNTGGPVYNGPVDVVRQLYKEGGLKSIFRGTGATLARDGPGSAAYFVSYESIKRILTPAGSDPQDLNLMNVLLAGGTAGMASEFSASKSPF